MLLLDSSLLEEDLLEDLVLSLRGLVIVDDNDDGLAAAVRVGSGGVAASKEF